MSLSLRALRGTSRCAVEGVAPQRRSFGAPASCRCRKPAHQYGYYSPFILRRHGGQGVIASVVRRCVGDAAAFGARWPCNPEPERGWRAMFSKGSSRLIWAVVVVAVTCGCTEAKKSRGTAKPPRAKVHTTARTDPG